MIEITELVKKIQGFNTNDFTVHLYEQALLDNSCHHKVGKWFNSVGQLVGRTAKAGVKNMNIPHKRIKATNFYIVDDVETALKSGGIIQQVHGAYILGVSNGEEE